MNEQTVKSHVVQQVANIGGLVAELGRWKGLERLPRVNGEAALVGPTHQRRIAEHEGQKRADALSVLRYMVEPFIAEELLPLVDPDQLDEIVLITSQPSKRAQAALMKRLDEHRRGSLPGARVQSVGRQQLVQLQIDIDPASEIELDVLGLRVDAGLAGRQVDQLL